ncbi:MAG: hypothetical protein JW913_20060 [Chitinispirillaceae bacterium]|nr:hypothetical protein [Chitinispirillaceae bacterium]
MAKFGIYKSFTGVTIEPDAFIFKFEHLFNREYPAWLLLFYQKNGYQRNFIDKTIELRQ